MLKSVETNHEGKVTILWNPPVQTDNTIHNNKPTIMVHGNEKGACMLIDLKDLTVEIQHMQNVKTRAIPAITEPTETISKSFRKYLNNILGKHKI